MCTCPMENPSDVNFASTGLCELGQVRAKYLKRALFLFLPEFTFWFFQGGDAKPLRCAGPELPQPQIPL